MNEKILTPKVRFKDFNDNYQLINLSSLMSFKNGINADKDSYGNGIKFINVLDILNNNYITYDKIIGNVDVDEKTLIANKVEYGDVLFQRSSEIREESGTANVYMDKEKPAVFGGFVIRGKKIGNYNPIYINELLKTTMVRKTITQLANGSTRFNIGQETLSSVSLYFPNLEEQAKIADFLSTVDEKILNLETSVKYLESIKRGFLQKIFSQELRFKDQDGKDFPEWETVKLGDVLIYEQPNKYIVSSTKYEEFKDNKNIPVLTANKGFILGYTSETSGIYNKGEVIIFDDFTMDLKYVIFPFKVKSSAMKMLTCNEQNSLKFLYDKLVDLKLQPESHKRNYISVVQEKIVNLPLLDEQQKIADFLSLFDKKIDIEKEKLEHWKMIKKGLLQKMFV